MPLIQYESGNLNRATIRTIDAANALIDEYERQGYDLTLRQLYYLMVARSMIPNRKPEYKRLVNVISTGRKAGLIDWDRIVDRTRYLRKTSTWSSPAAILRAAADSFKIDLWATQPYRPEVWIEKDALVGILEVACEPQQVPYFSCRGYPSDSEAWSAGQRFAGYARLGQDPILIHLGDHDPSGLDMSRDLAERIGTFAGIEVPVIRLALNMDQVEEFALPPNPAKEEDARFAGYRNRFGDESWELDALDPATITELIRNRIDALIDQPAWKRSLRLMDRHRAKLRAIADSNP